MKGRTRKPLLDDETPRAGESFLSRFHRRKTDARLKEAATDTLTTDDAAQELATTDAEPETASVAELTDADMPPLDNLDAGSDYTGFLSPKVSEPLRRAALRKLFHGAEFNVIDPLDDYAEDFTTFTALGDIVTSDMRHLLEVEARKQAEAIRQAFLDEDDGGQSTPDAGEHEPDEPERTLGTSQIKTDEGGPVRLPPQKSQ